ncbi:MAG TPA: FkbH-like protein, partial [Actinomycetota bacterium]|nr:FkbH-like protein [Actinomycetota bacterium]
ARRLSSSGTRITAGEIARRVDDPRWSVVVARLVDRFGDYGSIGAAFVERPDDGGIATWRLPFLAVSCRVAGKGVAEAVLAVIAERARAAGARDLVAEVRDTRHNLELRVLLKTCGFRAVERPDDDTILLTRSLADPGPVVPEWIDVTEAG